MIVIDHAVERSTDPFEYHKPVKVIVVVADVNRYMWKDQTLKGAIAQALTAWLKTYSGKVYVIAQYGYMRDQPGFGIQQVREIMSYTHPEYTSPPLSQFLDDVGIKELAFKVIDADVNGIAWDADENLCG